MPDEEEKKKDSVYDEVSNPAPVVEESSGAFVKPAYEELQKQVEEFKSGWQRAVADYKNLQKETSERRAEWAQLSEQMILEEFLPVYDNFKKAFVASAKMADANAPEGAANLANKELENWKQGVGFIMKQMGDILKAHKVEEIKTVGEKFDPKFHESVGEEDAEGKETHTVIREVEGGYVMGGRVIKPARVIVAT